MTKDIRDLFKEEHGRENRQPPKGHEKRFTGKLDEHFHEVKPLRKRFLWYKVAAVFILLLGTGYFLTNQTDFFGGQQEVEKLASGKQAQSLVDSTVFLSDVSPAYKKIEDYYLATLHSGIAQLNLTPENKALIDSFIAQLEELQNEYERLNNEITKNGVSEENVSLLIENLTLRLDLLFKLKSKLDTSNNDMMKM